jgi:hypothetical protein
VRLSKDAQRLKNMQLSKLGELSALSSVEKPILTPEQIAGHQTMWENDNIKDYPYLLINPMTDANGNEVIASPIGYTKPPQIPPAMAALLQITETDMKDLLGNQEQGEQMASNVAERTIELIQNKLDMQTFIYMDNMVKAIKRGGEIWLSMAKDIFVEEGREMETVGLQGEREQVKLLEPKVNEDGEITYANDLTQAKFKVIAEAGPSSSTKRQTTVRNLVKMAAMTDDPETKQVLGAMAMMNMEGEGIGDVRAYFRKKLVRMGVVKPTDKEAEDLKAEAENTPPDAQEEYLRAAAGAEEARGAKAQSDTILAQAKADEVRAKIIQMLSEIDIKEGEQAMDVIERLGPRVTPPNLPGSEVQE